MREARLPQPALGTSDVRPALPARLRPGVAVIGGLGIAAGAAGAIFGGNGDVTGLLALVAFVAFTQLVAIRLDAYGSVSVAAIGVIAGAALFGARSALLLAVTAAAVDWGVRRLPLAEIVLDVGSVSLGALAAAGIFALAPPGQVGDLATIAVGATAGAAYFAVVLGVFGIAAATEGREPWWNRFWGRFAWLVPYYGAYGFVAAVMALAYHRADAYALAAFAVPLLAVRGTQSIFVRQAESNAESLRNASDWIQAQATSLERVNSVLRQRTRAAMESLSGMVDGRDLFARGHSRRVSDLAQRVGRELGLSYADVDLVGQAALLHDIGKLAISDAILLKSGPLAPEEWLLMRSHAEKGARTIERLGFSDDAADAVRHHHEHVDGSGYPLGLRGEEIPLFARVIHVAEAFDAMCTTRFVWQRRTAEEAVTELRRLAGTQFDPRCVSALERALAAGPGWIASDA
jgi:putative nucleotidyltransferase with HDIG domain